VLHAILHAAGPRSRQICRALLDLYGPLRRLTPRGVETSSELLAALVVSGRHRELTSLDLSYVHHLITDDSLPALCEALPALRALRLHPLTWRGAKPTFSAAAVAAATSHLPQLTALHVGSVSDKRRWPHPLLTKWPIQGCPLLENLALPRSWVPLASTALPALTGLSRLAFGGEDCEFTAMHMSHIAAVAPQLPALVALELEGSFKASAQFQGLTQLTALKVYGRPAGQVLQHIGSLTNLRSLEVRLRWRRRDQPQHGWLDELACLTRLWVDFWIRPEGEGLGWLEAFDEVARSVPHLPDLRDLRFATSGTYGHATVMLPCAGIASASGSLRALALECMYFHDSMYSQVLPLLTGLTSLRLGSLWYSYGFGGFGWLTALTSLRELVYWSGGESRALHLPCELLAGLRSVVALTLDKLPFVDGGYLVQLCASMPQLTSLGLCNSESMGPALAALQHLTRLEVLAFSTSCRGVERAAEGWEHLRAPSSLRRCHLPEGRATARAVRGLLGRQVEVVPDVLQEEFHPLW
jgi:hypothetical protein